MEDKLRLFRIGLTVFLTFACCIFLFFVLYKFESVGQSVGKVVSAAAPIIIGLVLAYLMNPIMKFIEKCVTKLFSKSKINELKQKKAARGIAIAGSVIILLGFIAALIAMIVPSLISSISALSETLPDDVNSFIQQIRNGYFGDSPLAKTVTNYIVTFTDSIDEWATKTLLPQVQKYASEITGGVISVVRGLVNFIIGIIIMVYVMGIQETLKGQVKKILYTIFRPERANVIIKTGRKANDIFGGFITGKIVDSFIIGVICYIGCLILRIPSAVVVSVIIGITNIIPAFGPFFGAIPSLFLVVIQSPIHALYLVIFIIILQQLDGNIIGPSILGSSTGLSTFWVMFAILLGGGLFGFIGMVIGVPTFGVIYYIIQEIMAYVLKRKKLSAKTEDYIELTSIEPETKKMLYIKEEPKTEEEEKTEKKTKKFSFRKSKK